MLKKTRIIVVDDSPLFRNFIKEILSAVPHYEVIDTANSAEDALPKIINQKPDVVTLDIQMPGMSGIEMLGKLLPQYRVPVILVSSLNMTVFEALSAGAVDFLGKPDLVQNQSKNSFATFLIQKVKIASVAKVQINRSRPVASPMGPAVGLSNLSSNLFNNKKRITDSVNHNYIVAIGASTGGTEAIIQVVRELPAEFPPVVITQHMAPGFTAMYVERLNRFCNMPVHEAKHGDIIKPGNIYLAPSGLHMKLVKIGNKITANCFNGPRVHGVIPAVDYLFESVASIYREKAIGVILTGMGADGAKTLLQMRSAGAYTIGQNKETCVVYGMPMEAYKAGAVCTELPLNQIQGDILKYLQKKSL